MAQDQGRRAALVMTRPGVHVRPADADMRDPDQGVPAGLGIRRLAIVEGLGSGVDQGFHFALYPPSTWRIWPVT